MEVAVLRDSLRHEGTFNIPHVPIESGKQRDDWSFERYRRLNFLAEFINTCARRILDPEGSYELCGL